MLGRIIADSDLVEYNLAKGVRGPPPTGQETVESGMMLVVRHVAFSLKHPTDCVAALTHDPPKGEGSEVVVTAFGEATLKTG